MMKFEVFINEVNGQFIGVLKAYLHGMTVITSSVDVEDGLCHDMSLYRDKQMKSSRKEIGSQKSKRACVQIGEGNEGYDFLHQIREIKEDRKG